MKAESLKPNHYTLQEPFYPMTTHNQYNFTWHMTAPYFLDIIPCWVDKKELDHSQGKKARSYKYRTQLKYTKNTRENNIDGKYHHNKTGDSKRVGTIRRNNRC